MGSSTHRPDHSYAHGPSYTCNMPRRAGPLLTLLWLCFVVRLIFYASFLPTWEGLDEWAHFAHVDHLRQTGNAPSKDAPVSGEVAASLRLVPLPPHLTEALQMGSSHEDYWQLPEAERERRQRSLQSLRITEPLHLNVPAANYQAQHPPLPYRLMQVLDATLGLETLPARIFALRVANVLLASLCLPLLWLLCRRVFAVGELAWPACLILALMPGFAVYVSRVSNDALAAVLVSACLLLYCLETESRGRISYTIMSAAATAAAMLTKAYGVLLVPVYVMTGILGAREHRGSALRRLALFGATTGALAAWWYLPVLFDTGTLSGEQFDVAASATPFTERLANLFRVRWWLVWLYGSNSHIWFSGWSFVMLDEWMYWVFRAVGLIAAAGFVRAAIERTRKSPPQQVLTLPGFWQVPFPMICLFLLAIAYQGWQIFNARGDSTAQGWYLYGAVNAEIVVLIAGLGFAFGARHAAKAGAALALLLAALDLFTVHFLSLPYYSGLTSMASQGRTPLFSAHQWPQGGIWEIASRLTENQPSWISASALSCLWVLYLLASAVLVLHALSLFLPKASCDNSGKSTW